MLDIMKGILKKTPLLDYIWFYDVVLRHNHMRDVFVELCHQAHLKVKVEEGSGHTPDMSHTRPADVLVQNWVGGKPAAFDFTVTSPLIPKGSVKYTLWLCC